ncbi:MAG: AI-2E family transporter [Bacteroidia bacterium]|nr:AI-2E family transporter [Bacteroidia bacterium]
MIFISMVVWYFSDIVLYLLVSLVISSIIRPVTDYLENREVFRVRIPRLLAVILSFLLLATFPLIFILLFVPLILEQISVLQELDYILMLDQIKEPISYVDTFIIRNFQPDKESGFLLEELSNYLLEMVESIRIGSLLNYLLGFAGKIFIYLLSVTFITFFLLYEKGIMRRTLLSLIPNAYFEVAVTTIYKTEQLLSNYLIGLSAQITILFTIIASGLSILGINYALTIAVFAAFINLIPYIGPILGYLFAILVVFSTKSLEPTFNHYLFQAAKMLPVFAIAQLIDNLVLQPVIFSTSVKAHPLELFIIIFVGATIAGGLGMIAAIPVYTILRVSYIELSHGYQDYRIFQDSQQKPRIL